MTNDKPTPMTDDQINARLAPLVRELTHLLEGDELSDATDDVALSRGIDIGEDEGDAMDRYIGVEEELQRRVLRALIEELGHTDMLKSA